MILLTPAAIAERLIVSVSMVQKLIRAAEYAAEIKAGTRIRDDVPPGLVRYLDSGFPAPKVIGRAVKRIRGDEFEQWVRNEHL